MCKSKNTTSRKENAENGHSSLIHAKSEMKLSHPSNIKSIYTNAHIPLNIKLAVPPHTAGDGFRKTIYKNQT